MDVMQKDTMNYELKLLELLSLKLYKTHQNNEWIIVDENDNKVGFIRLEEIGNTKKDLPLCYYTKIEKEDILYENIRVLSSTKIKTNYDIKIKNNNQYDLVSIDVGEFPHITIFSAENGINSISLQDKKILLNTNRKIDDFIISENTKLNLDRYSRSYSYTTTFTNSRMPNRKMKFSSLFTEEKEGIVNTYQKFEDSNNPLIEDYGTIESNLEETVLKNENSTNSINYLVGYIRKLIPFSDKLFQEILKNSSLEKEKIQLLMSIINYKGDLSKILKKNI